MGKADNSENSAPQRRQLQPREPMDYDIREDGRTPSLGVKPSRGSSVLPQTQKPAERNTKLTRLFGLASADEAFDEDDEDPEDGDDDVIRTKHAADEFVGSRFQKSPDDKQQNIRVVKWVALITSSKAELLVLSQLAYWFGQSSQGKLRAKIFRDGYWWVYKTYNQLAKETFLTRYQVNRAVRNLRKRCILIACDEVGAGHRVHYRLNLVAIEKLVEAAEAQLSKEDVDENQ